MRPLTTLAIIIFALSYTPEANPNVLPLYRRSLNPAPRPLNRRSSGSNVPVTSTAYGTVFDIPVTFGDQTFLLTLDTGSSDTWVVQSGYRCFNHTDRSKELPQSACNFAPDAYNITSTFHEIDGEMFGVQYGGGIASGTMGYEDITLGNITVKQQEIGIANTVALQQNGIDSGLIGFGYPALTSAHPNAGTSNSSFYLNRTVYNPLFNNMYVQGLVDPYFSLAIERTPLTTLTAPGGYLGLGCLPSVSYSSNFSAVPVEITAGVPDAFISNRHQISYWTLTISSFHFGAASTISMPPNMTVLSTTAQAFVDSGNYYNFLPLPVVRATNALFLPPATEVADNPGYFAVSCNATAPTFALDLGGQLFYHNGADLILSDGKGGCVSALASSEGDFGGATIGILGDPFLKNVVAVFDFGKDEMRFAARTEPGGRGVGDNGTASVVGSASATSGGNGASASGVVANGVGRKAVPVAFGSNVIVGMLMIPVLVLLL